MPQEPTRLDVHLVAFDSLVEELRRFKKRCVSDMKELEAAFDKRMQPLEDVMSREGAFAEIQTTTKANETTLKKVVENQERILNHQQERKVEKEKTRRHEITWQGVVKIVGSILAIIAAYFAGTM